MVAILINQGTQTAIANDTVGTVNYQVIKVDMGTTGVSNPFTGTLPSITNLEAGTITKIEGGTVQTNILSGTINSVAGGSIAITAGTVDLLKAGTINRLEQGSIQVTAGTMASVGTVPGVGVVTSITNLAAGTITRVEGGSIIMTAGTVAAHAVTAATITAGTLTNLMSGTINSATVVINSATITTGTLGLVTRVGNIGTMESGTINGGTLGVVANGTINARITAPGLSAQGSFTTTGQTVGVTSVSTSGLWTYPSALVSLSGTHSGLNASFEISDDNSLWYPLNATRTDSFLSGTSTGVISDNSNLMWSLPIRGATYMRVKSLALSSGTANVKISPIGAVYEPGVTVGGTVNTNVISGTITSPITVSTAGFTRPADTTTYAAGDVVCNSTSAPVVITFANAVRSNAAGGVLNSVYMVDNANQTLPGVFELWLFHTTVTATNDNTAWNISDANMLNTIGVVPLSASYAGNTGAGTAGNRVFMAPSLGIPFKAASGATSLYGVLIARNAYIPVDSENFFFQLGIMAE